MRVALLLSISILPFVAHAGETTRLSSGAASSVTLDGSSNVAGWRCRGTTIDARALIAASPAHVNEVIDRIEDGNIGVWTGHPSRGSFPPPEFELAIPVASFRCGNRVMERDMYQALRGDTHPAIRFSFRQLWEGVLHDLDTGLYHATIIGDLTLAGVTRSIRVTVSAQRLSRTRFRIRAVLPLRMTDFGITPPSALFGAIRARNELKVRFDLALEIR